MKISTFSILAVILCAWLYPLTDSVTAGNTVARPCHCKPVYCSADNRAGIAPIRWLTLRNRGSETVTLIWSDSHNSYGYYRDGVWRNVDPTHPGGLIDDLLRWYKARHTQPR
jgi:hypothetical protein